MISSVDRQEAILDALAACPLYFILDESLFYSGATDRRVLEVSQRGSLALAIEVVGAGVRMIQLRAKNWPESCVMDFIDDFKRNRVSSNCLLIVNDDFLSASNYGANGVHLGEQDAPVYVVRDEFPDLIIGATERTCEGAWDAEYAGADYVGCGSVFASSTKGGLPVIGLDGLAAVNRHVSIPVVAIGGVTPANCASVLDTGVAGFCAIAPFREGKPADVVRAFMDAAKGHGWRAGASEVGKPEAP